MSFDLGDYIILVLLLAAVLGIFLISRSSRTGKHAAQVAPDATRKS